MQSYGHAKLITTDEETIWQLWPTESEWLDFGTLYKEAKFENDAGALLVTLPSSLSPDLPLHHYKVYGDRSQTSLSDSGHLQIQFWTRDNTDEFSFWLDTKFDPTQHEDDNTPMAAHVQRFESDPLLSPIYAQNKDVESARSRHWYGVPAVSTIYPLKSNQLHETKVACAGIHTPWLYFSEGFGTCSGLHIEDYNLASLNVHLGGASKIWTVIYPEDRGKLETALQPVDNPCGQFVRHQSIHLPNAKLDALHIRYTQFEQKKGQVVLILPSAYHQVFNVGANIAEALNFADEAIMADIPRYTKCELEICDHPGLPAEAFQPLGLKESQKIRGIQRPTTVDVPKRQSAEAGLSSKRQKTTPNTQRPKPKTQPLNPKTQRPKPKTSKSKQPELEQYCQDSNQSRLGLIIPVVALYQKLIAAKVSPDQAVMIASLTAEWGSQTAFREASFGLQALRDHGTFPVASAHNNSQMATTLQHLSLLGQIQSMEAMTAIATRFCLAALYASVDWKKVKSTQQISKHYCAIVQARDPSLKPDTLPFLAAREKLRRDMALGRRWNILIADFGPSLPVLWPATCDRKAVNSSLGIMTDCVFGHLRASLRKEQGTWIKSIGNRLGKNFQDRVLGHPTADVRFQLETAQPHNIEARMYRDPMLAGLCG